MKKKIFLIVFSFSLFSYSQGKIPDMTNIYKFGFIINPALSSFDFKNSFITLSHRAKWANVYDAPRYFLGTYSSRNINKKYSYDTYFLSNTVGVYNYSGFGTNYAYKLKISNDIFTSFGISLKFFRSTIDNSKIIDPNKVDLTKLNTQDELYYFNTGLGNVTRIKNFKIGISVDDILGVKISNKGEYKSSMVFRGYLGYDLGINFGRFNKKDIVLKPIVTASYISNIDENEENLDYGAYLMTEIKEKLKVQLGYGKSKGVNGILGISIDDNFEFYYGYDFGGEKLVGATSSSHEISLVYNIIPGGSSNVRKSGYGNTKGNNLSERDVLRLVNKSNKRTKSYIDRKIKRNSEIQKLNRKIRELESKKNKISSVDNKKLKEFKKRLKKLESKEPEIGDNIEELIKKDRELDNRVESLEKDKKELVVNINNKDPETKKNILNLKKKLKALEKKQRNSKVSKVDKDKIEGIKNRIITLENKDGDVKNKDLYTKEINKIKRENLRLRKKSEEYEQRLRKIENKEFDYQRKMNAIDEQIEKYKNISKEVNYSKLINELKSLINIINNSDNLDDKKSKSIIGKIKNIIDDKAISFILNDENDITKEESYKLNDFYKGIKILQIYVNNKLKVLPLKSIDIKNYNNLKIKIDDLEKVIIKKSKGKIKIDEDDKKVSKKTKYFYLIKGVYSSMPKEALKELKERGFKKANYIRKSNGLYYIYINKFKTNKEAEEFKKSRNL